MATYTMTNPATGVSVTSQEMSVETCEYLVELGRADKVNPIEFTINYGKEEKAEEIHIEIEALFNAPESKEGAKGIMIINNNAAKKIDALSWKLYRLRSAQRYTPHAYSDSRMKTW